MMVSPYSVTMLGGIIVSALLWCRIGSRDRRLPIIYIGALLGAFIGAKLVYLVAEGWQQVGEPDMWLQLATGKSILGALLGGYAGVELVKYLVGYRDPTGDWFALIAPISIALGRIGCLLHGCCLGTACSESWYALHDGQGVARWPVVPLEILFNIIALLSVLVLRRNRLLTGQHFHLYLVGYGLFRFFHEFVRATPKVLGPLSIYQLAALAVACLGAIGFVRRQQFLPKIIPLSPARS
jgi:phosphatidylglycerol:prolipoprotein diacylglycerol transferase